MKLTLTKSNIFLIAVLLLILTNTTLYTQERAYKIELPKGAIARIGRGSIHDLKYSVDGTRIAVSTSIGIWIYDTTKLTEIYLLNKDKFRSIHLAISPNGKTLASASLRGTIHIWDIDTGELKKQLHNPELVPKMRFSSDGTTFAMVRSDGSMLIWDTDTWKKKHEIESVLDPNKDDIWNVSINPGNYAIATSNDNGIVSIYDPISRESKEMSKIHGDDLVYWLTFNQDGSRLASRSNSEVRIWDAESGKQIQKIDIVPVGGRVAFSPDSNLLANYTYSGNIQLFDVKTGKKYRSLDLHTAFIVTIDFCSDMRTFASASYDGSLRFWNIFTGKQIHAIYDHFGYIRCIDVSPDGKTVVAPSSDLNVSLWDVASGEVINAFYNERNNPVNTVSFDPIGNIIAVACGSNKTIELWESETGKMLKTMEGHAERIDSVMFSPDGKTIATGSRDNTVRIWDVEASNVISVLNRHEKDVTIVEFSPDSTTIASGSTDRRIILWDANTGQEKEVLAGHETGVVDLSFSPDGSQIASIELSSEIYLWEAGSGKLAKVINVDDSSISSVLFLQNSKTVVIGCDTGDVHLIDIDSEKPLHKYRGHLTQITDLALALDGNRLVSLSDDGVIFVWDITGIVR